MTDNKEMAKRHENYPDIWSHGMFAYGHVINRIKPIYYEIPEGAKVLDVGCNSGEFLKFLKERKGCDIYGVDISQKVIDLCKEKGIENVYQCDADKLPFPDNTFDVVTMMEVLEHLDDPVIVLKEIKRVMKKDGMFLGSCPHANLERHVWEDERMHKGYYDDDGLEAVLAQVFEKNYVYSLSGSQFNISLLNYHLAKEPCQILFKSGGKNCEPWEEQGRKGKAIKVWWGFTQLAGVVYYRMKGFLDKMDQYGIESAHEKLSYDLKEVQTSWQSRLSSTLVQDEIGSILKVADLSIWQPIQNKHGVPLLMAAKELYKKPIVMEMDDWFFDLPSYNIASHPFTPNSDNEWEIYKQIEVSDAIVCSTQFIKDNLLKIFPDKTIYVIPNALDFALWDVPVTKGMDAYPKETGKIRIGFTGCSNHNGDLEIIMRPLRKIMEEHPNVELITHSRFKALEDLPNVIYTGKWIPIDKYPDEMKRWNMDIGIAPLRDNNFNRAKSNLRWLEYSALKVPTIASHVYPFSKSIKDGKDGILCKNSDLEWYETLKDLIVNEGKRIAIGEKAYDRVKEDYNMDTVAKVYADVIKEIKCNELNWMPKSADSSEIPAMTAGA